MFDILPNLCNHVIDKPVEVYNDTLNSISLRVAELLRPAVRANALSIILIHSYPSGDPTPSQVVTLMTFDKLLSPGSGNTD